MSLSHRLASLIRIERLQHSQFKVRHIEARLLPYNTYVATHRETSILSGLDSQTSSRFVARIVQCGNVFEKDTRVEFVQACFLARCHRLLREFEYTALAGGGKDFAWSKKRSVLRAA